MFSRLFRPCPVWNHPCLVDCSDHVVCGTTLFRRLLGGAIDRPCPSCMKPIIYPVIITFFYIAQFPSMRKYIYCIYIVFHPTFFLLLPSLPSSLTPSVSPPSLFPSPSLPPSILVDLPLTFICYIPILKLAKLGSGDI